MGTTDLAAECLASGFFPVPLAGVCAGTFEGLDVFLKTRPAGKSGNSGETYSLFRAKTLSFTREHQRRLIERGVEVVYIALADERAFRRRAEYRLLELVGDAGIANAIKAERVYQTSIHLMDELLGKADLRRNWPRIENVSRAVTLIVLNDPTAFSHLFLVGRHDAYTAAHVVNVATWMVPLAYAMGHRDAQELIHICQAGLLHDIGKTYIPAEILTQNGPLSDEQWRAMKRHPELGWEHLSRHEGIDPLLKTIAMQHHERMDGSGYPQGLTGEDIHPISRMCGVVDSFDAMTAARVYKKTPNTQADATQTLLRESPAKYDGEVTRAWNGLMGAIESAASGAGGVRRQDGKRRGHERFRIDCPARVHPLEPCEEGLEERLGMLVVANNISRSGLGMLSQKPLLANRPVRAYLLGDATLNQIRDGVAVRCRDRGDGWFEIGIHCEGAGAGAGAGDKGLEIAPQIAA